ncbi:NAD-P-binding protein [Peniophora sp. CONT]|nr:NAD-P-binding protein [Peniophora sp. CONT]
MTDNFKDNLSKRGWNENLPVEQRHEVYPTIDPASAWSSHSLKGKALFITGASRGIGRTTALTFAKAGADVAIAARSSAALDETEALILKEIPGAKVEKYVVDVTKSEEVEKAVESAAKAFGRLDYVVANAGYTNPFDKPMEERSSADWWRTFEINVLGVFNTVRPALKYLRASEGYVVAITSIGAQFRTPSASDYQTSKHAVNRLVEMIGIENPKIKAFSLHPGGVATELAKTSGLEEKGVQFIDSPELPACTMLYLCTGKADYLDGRYVSANWDLGQVEKEWKERILEKDLLVNKLDVVGQ